MPAIKAVKAVILAGGRGKRLRPITDYVPKPMVPINNVPIIEWQINYLQKHGIRDIIVCTGYKSEMLADFLGSRQAKRLKITISAEEKPLGTAGAVRKIGPMIREKAFFVINGDVITDIDLKELAKRPNSLASIPLRTKFGVLEISGDKITAFREKKQVPGLWMNAGVYCLQREILADLPKKGDLERTLFPDYAGRGKLSTVGFKNAMWHSIDSFKDIEECSVDLDKIIK